MKVEAGKIVEERRVEEQAIEPVEYAAMSWQNVGRVVCARATFKRAFSEVAEDADDGHHGRKWQGEFERQLAKEPEVREGPHCQCSDNSANRAFPCFAG